MSFLRKPLHYLGTWFHAKLQSSHTVTVVEEFLPDKLDKKSLYIVVEDGYTEQVAMVCPCGCKQVLHMNMIPDERPCWLLRENQDGSYDLHPSIWRKKGCHSHFWFKNNRIHWCRGSGPWWSKF